MGFRLFVLERPRVQKHCFETILGGVRSRETVNLFQRRFLRLSRHPVLPLEVGVGSAANRDPACASPS